MSDTQNHYDVIVIGSGPGGGTMVHTLAKTGKRILLLERGDYLKREQANWDTDEVFLKARYQAKETWYSSDGREFAPGLHYFVGGNSKVYGSILFRLRERDFNGVQHPDGVAPEWMVKYDEFEPYYQAAEEFFQVHGERGEDPTEPPAKKPYAYPAIKHEPRIQELNDGLVKEGLHPFHLPVGVLLDQDEHGEALPHSPCIRCNRFDGYPCLVNGKSDAQIIAVDPAVRENDNVTLLTRAYADKLLTNPTGTAVTGVSVIRDDVHMDFTADIVVVACGALSSALLLLRSANDAHPTGLANKSDQVGRNYIRHNNAIVMAISKTPNHTRFQKTLGINDYYFGADDWEFPLGAIQMVGKSDGQQVHGEGLPKWMQWFPEKPFDWLAQHSIDFWLTSEDLPKPFNRIHYKDDKVHLDLTETNVEGNKRLKHKLEIICNKAGIYSQLVDRGLYLGQNTPIGGTAHQAGTLRFGPDPATSVLDRDCRAHGIDNLYVTDASFFPSIGAVNPTLTIIANALRVADRIKERLQ
jgi:choline dehydrogenase-like flavoprotein